MFEKIAHPQRRAFLAAYADCGRVKEAAEIAGISREAHYDWLQDEDYAAAFAFARELAGDLLEDEAKARAMDRSRKSDKVLLTLLVALKPEVYGKRVEHNHRHRHSVDWSAFSDEELRILEQLADKSGALRPPADPSGDGEAAGAEVGQDVPGDGGTEA